MTPAVGVRVVLLSIDPLYLPIVRFGTPGWAGGGSTAQQGMVKAHEKERRLGLIGNPTVRFLIF